MVFDYCVDLHLSLILTADVLMFISIIILVDCCRIENKSMYFNDFLNGNNLRRIYLCILFI